MNTYDVSHESTSIYMEQNVELKTLGLRTPGHHAIRLFAYTSIQIFHYFGQYRYTGTSKLAITQTNTKIIDIITWSYKHTNILLFWRIQVYWHIQP